MERPLAASYRQVTRIASWAIIGLGFLVLVGWVFDISGLKSVFSGLATMKVNTALAFVFSALSLWYAQSEAASDRQLTLQRWFAGIALLLGLITLLEYGFGWSAGIDQFLIRDVTTSVADFPGRMSQITALCFMLSGLALLTLGKAISQYFSTTVMALSVLALVGYLFDYQGLYQLAGYGSVALHTALAFLVLSMGILAARPNKGLMTLFSSPLAGGQTARRLIPISVLLIVLVGLFVKLGEQRQLFDQGNGLIVEIVLLILVYVPLLYFSARAIDRSEVQIIRLDRLYATLSHVNQAIIRATEAQSLFQRICDIALEVGGFQLVWIGVLQPESDLVEIVAIKGKGADLLRSWAIRLNTPPFDQGLVGLGFRNQTIVTSADVQKDERTVHWRELSRTYGFRSAATVPIQKAGKVIGCLNLYAAQPGFFQNEQELLLLQEIGGDISFALDSLESQKSSWLLSAIVDGSNDAIITKDLNGIITSWNRGAERLFGYSAAETIGEPILKLIPADRVLEEDYILGQIRSGQAVNHYETIRIKKDGTSIDVSLTVSPIKDQSGKVIGASKIARDISARKQDERQIQLQTQLLNQTRDAVIASDANYQITYWNAAAEKLYGWQADEVLGRDGVDILKTQFSESEAEEMRTLIREKGYWLGEVTQVKKDGSRFTCEVSSTVLYDENQQIKGFISVNRDLTDRLQAQEVLRQYEVRFQKAFHSSPAALNITRVADSSFVDANESFEHLTGYTRAEIIGRNAFELQLFPDPQVIGMIRTELEKVGSLRNVEVQIQNRARQVRHVLFSTEPMKIGDEAYNLTSIIDITERKQVEERFRLAIEAAPNALVMVDQAGQIVLVNSRTEGDFGYSRAELLTMNIDTLVPERFRKIHAAHRQDFYKDPQVRPMGVGRDLYGLRKNQTEFPIEIGLAPVSTSDGNLVMATIVDITERKQAQMALQNTLSELQRSNQELEQFAYAASHDLQEPLRTLTGMAQLLDQKYKGSLDESANRYIDFMVDAADRMKQLINGLLQYSRLNRLEPSFEEVDLNRIVKTVKLDLNGTLTGQNITITQDDLPIVLADSTQMARLFQNLLSNAVKFHSERAPMIHVGVRQNGQFWEFSVSDNGIGIDPRYFERIFVIFQRLHTRTEYPGTGIGLALCKKIVERYHGKIWVESEPGVGSSFHFTLPREMIK